MTHSPDPLQRWLSEQVDAATPATTAPFDDVRRRVRRDRTRTVLAVAASVLVVGMVATGTWALRPDAQAPRPAGPESAPTTHADGPRPTPNPDPTLEPGRPDRSGIVVRRPEGDLELPADTSCWAPGTECRRALMASDDSGPDLGVSDSLIFWFARPGWRFEAVSRPVGEVCPRATTVRAESLGGQWFRLPAADRAGTHEVSLRGRGPGTGLTETRFTWTTVTDGAVEDPAGTVWLFPDAGSDTVSVELAISDLGVHPTVPELSAEARVRLSGAGGTRTMQVPLVPQSLECGVRGERGSFYFQVLDLPIAEAVLGPRAGTVQVEARFDLGGTTYVGRGTSRGGTGAGEREVPLTFSPALP